MVFFFVWESREGIVARTIGVWLVGCIGKGILLREGRDLTVVETCAILVGRDDDHPDRADIERGAEVLDKNGSNKRSDEESGGHSREDGLRSADALTVVVTEEEVLAILGSSIVSIDVGAIRGEKVVERSG